MAKKFPAELEGFDQFGDLIGLTLTRCENGFSQCFIEVKHLQGYYFETLLLQPGNDGAG